jgi:hypothetical protein
MHYSSCHDLTCTHYDKLLWEVDPHGICPAFFYSTTPFHKGLINHENKRTVLLLSHFNALVT